MRRPGVPGLLGKEGEGERQEAGRQVDFTEKALGPSKGLVQG